MAGTVKVPDAIAPASPGQYPTHADVDCFGGFISVADITERNALLTNDPVTNHGKHGMWVFTRDTETYWKLESNGSTWTAISFGGGLAPVANLTVLAALDAGDYNEGDAIFVITLLQEFRLVHSTTLTASPQQVIATNLANWWWVRDGLPSLSWSRITTYYVNRALGNDENPGTSTGAGALKTVDELGRRLRFQVIAASIDCFIEDAPAAAIDLHDIYFPPLAGFTPIVLRFRGTPFVERTTTITAYTQFDPTYAINNLSSLDDAGATATDRNRRLYNITVGPRQGSSAWYGKNPPGVQGWTSGPRITSEWGKSDYTSIFGLTTFTPPNVGDTVQVQSLTAFPIANVQFSGGLGCGIVFDQLQLTGGLFGMTFNAVGGAYTYLYNCDLNNGQFNARGPIVMVGCSTRQGGVYAYSLAEIYAGILSTISSSPTTPSDGVYAYNGSYVILGSNVRSDQSRGLVARSGSTMLAYGFGHFNTGSSPTVDAYGSPINVAPGGTFLHRSNAGSVKLFGKFSTRTGASIALNGSFTTQNPNDITITGGNNLSGFDFEVNKVNDLFAWNDSTGAFEASTRVGLWSNFTAPVAMGGFGGFVGYKGRIHIGTEATFP